MNLSYHFLDNFAVRMWEQKLVRTEPN